MVLYFTEARLRALLLSDGRGKRGYSFLAHLHPRLNKKAGRKARLFDNTNSGPYLAAINALVISNMRLEKPHSLSYQLSTFTSVPPMTRVCVAS